MQVIETVRGHFDLEENGIAYCALWAQNDKDEWEEFEAECEAKLLHDVGIELNRGFFCHVVQHPGKQPELKFEPKPERQLTQSDYNEINRQVEEAFGPESRLFTDGANQIQPS